MYKWDKEGDKNEDAIIKQLRLEGATIAKVKREKLSEEDSISDNPKTDIGKPHFTINDVVKNMIVHEILVQMKIYCKRYDEKEKRIIQDIVTIYLKKYDKSLITHKGDILDELFDILEARELIAQDEDMMIREGESW